jgi:hypothetical protein
MEFNMNLDKATKRIAKKVKQGFHGYPLIALEYFGNKGTEETELMVSFTLEEGAAVMHEHFFSKTDARKDETIQTTLVKIIERADAKTVTEVDGMTLKA